METGLSLKYFWKGRTIFHIHLSAVFCAVFVCLFVCSVLFYFLMRDWPVILHGGKTESNDEEHLYLEIWTFFWSWYQFYLSTLHWMLKSWIFSFIIIVLFLMCLTGLCCSSVNFHTAQEGLLCGNKTEKYCVPGLRQSAG